MWSVQVKPPPALTEEEFKRQLIADGVMTSLPISSPAGSSGSYDTNTIGPFG